MTTKKGPYSSGQTRGYMWRHGMSSDTTQQRLAYLRSQIRAERISYGEIAELQALASDIEPGDVELLEWAAVPEVVDSDDREGWATDEERNAGTFFS